jgi:Cof subfamily protein (haloacid dehalogenase superfamily)
MPALYISDLDGTLLGSDACLSDFSRNALRELLADGVLFSVASARGVASMRPILRGVGLRLPVINLNGAFLSDLETGRHEVVNSLDAAVAEDLYGTIVKFGCAPFLATFDGTADCLYHPDAVNGGMRWYLDDRVANRDERLRRAGNQAMALADEVVCMTVIGLGTQLAELEVAVREPHGPMIETHLFENPYSPGWHWLTIHDRRATKAQGVRTLIELYGLDGKELIAFGDHLNDVKLFEIAAHAVAVANAEETVKRAATQIIGSNEEDSVVKYIHEHWRSKPG